MPTTTGAGTEALVQTIIDRLDGQDVHLCGGEWRATWETPRTLVLQRWVDRGERDVPTGPKARITFTVHVEEIP